FLASDLVRVDKAVRAPVSPFLERTRAAQEASGERQLTAVAPRRERAWHPSNMHDCLAEGRKAVCCHYVTISGRRLLPVCDCGMSLHNLRTNHASGLSVEVNGSRLWIDQVRELLTNTGNAATAARPVAG